MTNREFYTAVMNANVNTEMTEFAKAAIAKMDARNESRKGKLTNTQKENLVLRDKIMNEVEAETTYTAAVIGEMVGVRTAKASGQMLELAKAGYFTKTKVPVKGKGKQTGYVRTDKVWETAAE